MTLTIQTIVIPSAHFGDESVLPSLYNLANVQALTQSDLDEDDGLFVGYGRLASIFPYPLQNHYDRALEPTEYRAVVLENDYLKATFIPAFGGRLWSLYDKVKGRDLLYTNPVIRPCNLALRNAWLAGGIEFNCGMIGHSPFTSSCIHAAETHLADGTPVLRMYEYERVRGCVYQMDFFLPDDSRQLLARMRIVNPRTETVPMYWWTNMAVREQEGARNIIDATESYNNAGGRVGKNPVPYRGGLDITYPNHNPIAIDYFWKIPQEARKYTAYLDREGYGFFQTSTARLRGRKLFVWGQGEGGARWQEFLTEPSADVPHAPGRYAEIQAGLAYTQYECLPMPPKTAWEWMEAYGAMTADPAAVHGDWADARAEVSTRLEGLLSAERLEQMLIETKPMALAPADRVIGHGAAWGTLENRRRAQAGEPIMCPHLDFGALTAQQKPWDRLLEQRTLASSNGDMACPPVSWMYGDAWIALLEASEDCHEKYLHLAAMYLANHRLRDADEALTTALRFDSTAIAIFLRSQILYMRGETDAAALLALEAQHLLPGDLSLARQAFVQAFAVGRYAEIRRAYESAPEAVCADGRIAMFYAYALLRLGYPEEAETILWREGGLSITDIREGEMTLSNLYIDIQKAYADRAGAPFDPTEVDIPQQFDFRMKVSKKPERH